MWLVLQRKILTRDNLCKRGWLGDVNCVFCSHSESINHLFLFFHIIFYFWASFNDYNHRGIQLPLHSVSIMWETACSLSASDRTYCLSFILVTFMSLLEF
jgi:zinc-binding in reverse transcriptase